MANFKGYLLNYTENILPLHIDLARYGNLGCANKILGVQNATFDENPLENVRIKAILGCD